MEELSGKPQNTSEAPEHVGSRRDPEELPVSNIEEAKAKSLDKMLADSFPTSASTIKHAGVGLAGCKAQASAY